MRVKSSAHHGVCRRMHDAQFFDCLLVFVVFAVGTSPSGHTNDDDQSGVKFRRLCNHAVPHE